MSKTQSSLPFDCSGLGRITASAEFSASCEWNCSQLFNGNIEVRCKLTKGELAKLRAAAIVADKALELSSEERNLTFEGQTADGGTLRLDSVDFVLSPTESELVFHVAEALWSRNTGNVPSHLVFHLVNHEISAVPSTSVVLPSGFVAEGTLISLQLLNGLAYLRAVDNQDDIIDSLEESGGVAVTTDFFLPICRQEDLDASLKIAHHLCCVLTLLSGNRINWISYSMVAADGSIIVAGAQNTVTRSYQKTDLVNTLSDRKVQLRISGTTSALIISRMMERFQYQEEKWNLVAIINSFHEAISSGHFFEQQGQLLANCVEMLRQSYLQNGGNEFVLPTIEFEGKQKALIKGVKKLLNEQFPEAEGWTKEQRDEHRAKLSQMATHIKGANRYGFKHALIEIADELKMFSQEVCESLQEKPDPRGFLAPLRLDPADAENEASKADVMSGALTCSIRAFVDIRDCLTHQGRFLVPPVDEDSEWTSRRINEERYKQERFMERFVAAFLTTILGWHQPLPTPPILYKANVS